MIILLGALRRLGRCRVCGIPLFGYEKKTETICRHCEEKPDG
jgi:uncharacterized Zn finger protein (UPF0148 family)